MIDDEFALASSQSVGVIEERQVARVFAAVRRVSSEAQPATGSNALDFLVRKMDALFQGNPVGKDGPPPVDLHLSALTDVSYPLPPRASFK